MTAPYKRRRDPMPVAQGWEIAVAGLGLGVILIALATLTGVGIAAAAFGGGWVWPHGVDTIAHALGGLATGHLGRGLPLSDRRRLASPLATHSCVAICALFVIAGGTAAAIAVARWMRNDGMATRRDAELVLGLGELRSARAIIRPDLYGAAVEQTTRRRSVFGERKQTP